MRRSWTGLWRRILFKDFRVENTYARRYQYVKEILAELINALIEAAERDHYW